MRLVCISDTHNSHKGIALPPGDMLIHAGDATGQGLSQEVERFLDWFAAQPHRHKVFVAGNHDWLFARHPDTAAHLIAARPGITYLQDSGIEIEGFKIWGSPWQPWFCDWAFNLPRDGEAIQQVWAKIPDDMDILITHGPPHGILDQVHGGAHLGCGALRTRLKTVRPRVHVFGHIHDAYGVAQSSSTVYVNGCVCDEVYRPTHRPVVLDLHPDRIQIHGIEANERLVMLRRVEAALMNSHDSGGGGGSIQLPRLLEEGIRGMANIRGVATEDLLRDYLRRGLESDLARQLRAENKPSRLPIPFTRLED